MTRPGEAADRIDLHLHSTASDGSLAPAALIAAARRAGLTLVSLTDHDTVAGVSEAVAAADSAIQVLPGVEISADLNGSEVHVLGYGVDPTHAAVSSFADRAAARREERMREMIERLEAENISVTLGEVEEEAGPGAATLARPHLARVLQRRGFVRSPGEAFERFLADGRLAHVPVRLVTADAAVALIHEAGGLAVWAHPPVDLFDREIRGLAEAGLDGVEALRPRTPPVESLLFEEVGRDLGLFITGGSDWHGHWSGPLGSFSLRRDDVSEFLDRLGV